LREFTLKSLLLWLGPQFRYCFNSPFLSERRISGHSGRLAVFISAVRAKVIRACGGGMQGQNRAMTPDQLKGAVSAGEITLLGGPRSQRKIKAYE
jgi:hypothetical protein